MELATLQCAVTTQHSKKQNRMSHQVEWRTKKTQLTEGKNPKVAYQKLGVAFVSLVLFVVLIQVIVDQHYHEKSSDNYLLKKEKLRVIKSIIVMMTRKTLNENGISSTEEKRNQ